MATPAAAVQWFHIAILALLTSSLTSAHVVEPPTLLPHLGHMVKPPKPHLDHHVVKPTKPDLAYMVNTPTPDLDHVVKPPKPDLAYMVNTPTPDLDHVVKPPKPDLDHVVKPPRPDLGYVSEPAKPDLDHVVKPTKPDLAYMVNPPSTLDWDNVVKPPPKPARLRKLQIGTNGESEASNSWASDFTRRAAERQNPQMEKTGAWASGCSSGYTNPGYGSSTQGGIYGGGQGSGGASIGFNNIFPFPSLPFGLVVPGVSAWGGGGGYGGANTNPGTGVNCPCTNGFPMHYVLSPIPYRPMDTNYLDRMRRYNPYNMAPPSPRPSN